MTRTRRGYIARRRRTKRQLFASSFRGARLTTQQEIRALASSQVGRGWKKINFRRLWITRINSVIRGGWIYSTYSRLIHDLYTRQLLLNRKIISQISIANQNFLYLISNDKTNEKTAICPQGVSRGMNSGKIQTIYI
uniref:Large ribosomal subunit protein bL20c n=1 Tax=Monopsis flava TaxID=2041137 RepID=A0A291F1D5_9ASTR|nr:ribosomal protein L20 [Monopsis flava]ATG25946.1 ribosomal protein L20 [Monopsis flava]